MRAVSLRHCRHIVSEKQQRVLRFFANPATAAPRDSCPAISALLHRSTSPHNEELLRVTYPRLKVQIGAGGQQVGDAVRVTRLGGRNEDRLDALLSPHELASHNYAEHY